MNTKNFQYSDSSSIYPGAYTTAFPNNEEIIEKLKDHEDEINLTAVNIIEYDDFFKLELIAPGLKKEEICVLVNYHELVVYVIHEELPSEQEKYHLRQFNLCPFCKVITIPENIDTDFIVSFYENGILKIYCPKTIDPFKKRRGKIAVY